MTTSSLHPVGPVHLAGRFAPLDAEVHRALAASAADPRRRGRARALVSREWLHPVLDLFLRAPPHRYRDVAAEPGTKLHVTIEGDAGGDWTLRRHAEGQRLYSGASRAPAARVRMGQDTAWRLFSKGLGPADARERVTVEGDQVLGAGVLGALAVMA